jgi:flagellar FliJ protein
MCAFKFRLEPVVSLRKQVERERKSALALARKDLGRKEARLVNLCEHKDDCQNQMGQEMSEGNLDVTGNLIYYAYIEKLADDIAAQAIEVKQSREDVETKRDLLLESSKEKKMLEKLKERMKERYIANAKKCEQGSLDETAGKAHIRKQKAKILWAKE